MSLLLLFLSWIDLPVVAIFLALYILGVVVLRRYNTAIRDVPGPLLASFSRLWHIYHIIIGDQNLRLVELHKQHGHFVRISHNEVSVSHPDAVRQILLSSLKKAPWYKIMAIPDYRFQTPFSTLEPKAKRERSKHFAPGYAMTNLLVAERQMDLHFASLKAWIDSFARDNRPMELDKFISYATYDVAGEMLFSQPFGFLEAGNDIRKAISNNVALNLHVALAGFLHSLHTLLIGNPLMTKARILPMGHLFDITVSALDERRKNVKAHVDMVSHWLIAQRHYPDRISVRDVYAHTINSVAGASDTISIGLQSFIYYMARHPTALLHLRTEIGRARKEGFCQTKIISFADATRLPFLHACIKEALRIFTPVGMGMARIAGKEGVRFGNRVFPLAPYSR